MTKTTEGFIDMTAIEKEARQMRAEIMRSVVRSAGQWLRARLHGGRAAELA
ncbi:RSP_7527 family protein [Celeribacter sp. PS-C1]|uniref:RSP_7527 family protein n=1 Tax=Celeribacter sp. PS-C1 TaxID=2820813 RepID=UPI001CA5EB00|nr:hypothetical protein [Celeribacter sp. PS-C1]MBW6417337.1 hypothetical protein [Celeribacter sp. PS-C1]